MASALAGASCIKVLLWRIWLQGALHEVGALSKGCNRLTRHSTTMGVEQVAWSVEQPLDSILDGEPAPEVKVIGQSLDAILDGEPAPMVKAVIKDGLRG